MPISFYECCYEFLPRAQPQDKIHLRQVVHKLLSIFYAA
ncbi:hypothetical protein FLY73_002436 [Escherichia coli]|nr:hypothetical protein [Escherichia coli]